MTTVHDRTRLTGRSLPRTRDREVLCGEGTYVGDVRLPGMLHATFYRSPHAHARITRLSLAKALDLPGVVLGLTADDLRDRVHDMKPFPFQSRDPFRGGNPAIKFADRVGLAQGKVRYVGEPVALIVAENRYVAEDALELVEAEYELLAPVLDAETGAGEDAPLLYEDWDDNVTLRFDVSGGDVDTAFADADVVVERTLRHHRFSGTPIEPRGVVARYDEAANALTVWTSSQIAHAVGVLLENSIKADKRVSVRVVTPRVGGGFGQKWGFYPEELVVPVGAMLAGRPVRWIETRREHMLATNHAREQTHHVSMALRRDGTILGLRDRIYADLGDAYPVGGLASIVTTPMFVPGAYRIENYEAHLFGVATNKTPFGAHRGFGKSEAAFCIERMMDEAARVLGLDPVAVRMRNFIPPEDFPYVCATGSRYDSGNYPGAMTRLVELLDYEGWRERQQAARAEGRLIGIGTILAIEPSSSTRMGSYNNGYYSVRVAMDPAGQVVVATGGSDEGQGHSTTIAQLVGDELGIDPEAVRVVEGDTDHTPYGSGSYSSRFSVVGTSAVTLASRKLAEKVRRIAAHLLEANVDDVDLVDGRASVRGTAGDSPETAVAVHDVARVAYHRIHDLPPEEEPGLELIYHYRDPNVDFPADERGRVAMFSSFPYSADGAVVEVDPETGQVKILSYVSVHDCGNHLNPKIVEGQHLGALAHGLGGALFEQFTYAPDGQPLNRQFREYLVPTAADMPPLTLEHIITPNPFTPGGYKGAGETGTVTPVPCLANAVEDAVRPAGGRIDRLPLTPRNVWTQLHREHAND
ncbi:MAG: xanthine dehydrogenase family protein [Streptosporangiales bacterium]|nr:xanthine dehydrogenase family protein [Streptosporangiales bacterium]MBO0891833.1 xanthine dehydrogenase family protein [Acidothermales bacterium]